MYRQSRLMGWNKAKLMYVVKAGTDRNTKLAILRLERRKRD